jgi:GNS1/SUR4 family
MNGCSKTGVKPLLAGLADRASKNFLLRLLLPSALVQESTSKALSRTPAVAYSHLDLLHNVKLRAASKYPTSCFDSTGAVFALHVNTLYMLPLLMLFAQFFIRSYLAGPQSATRKEKANGKVGYANGKAKSSSARA